MELLPNFDKAIIGIEKLAGYSLNRFHERGKDKAFLFNKVFGIQEYHAEILRKEILNNLGRFPAILKDENEYGKKFSLLMKISILVTKVKYKRVG